MEKFPEPEIVQSYSGLASYLIQVADHLRDHPEDWENATLEDFLRAWSAWLEDSPGYYSNNSEEMPQRPSWSDVAGMILAAKSYE